MNEFLLDGHPDQEFTTILGGQRCTLRFRYNVSLDRWGFDLRIGDDDVLFGRRVVPGVDLLEPFDFGIGPIIAVSFDGSPPDRQSIPEQRLRVYHIDEDEIARIRASRLPPPFHPALAGVGPKP